MSNVELPMTETTVVDEKHLPQPTPGHPTIADLFASEIKDLADQETLQDIKQKLEQEDKSVRIFPGVFNQKFYETVFQFVFKKLQQLIAIDIPKDVLAQSWSKYAALEEYLDQEKYPPDQVFKAVLMLEQTMHAKYHIAFKPVVAVLGKRIVLNQFSFPIALELLVKAGQLGIKDGKIISLSVGSCHVKGEIKCKYGNGTERLLVKQYKDLDLSREYYFKEGVPIKIPNKDELLAQAAGKTDQMVQNLAQDPTVAQALSQGRKLVDAAEQANTMINALEKGNDVVQSLESGDALEKVIENREAIAAALGKSEVLEQANTVVATLEKGNDVLEKVTASSEPITEALGQSEFAKSDQPPEQTNNKVI